MPSSPANSTPAARLGVQLALAEEIRRRAGTSRQANAQWVQRQLDQARTDPARVSIICRRAVEDAGIPAELAGAWTRAEAVVTAVRVDARELERAYSAERLKHVRPRGRPAGTARKSARN